MHWQTNTSTDNAQARKHASRETRLQINASVEKTKMTFCMRKKSTLNMCDIVAMPWGSALPLPLRPRRSGHAALSGPVLPCSSG